MLFGKYCVRVKSYIYESTLDKIPNLIVQLVVYWASAAKNLILYFDRESKT